MNENAAELSSLPDYLKNILTAIIPLIGLVAFIMILSGGFKILTSAGDPKGIQSGSKTITMAVAGIALAILSWLILVLIKNLTGVNVTEFNFGF